jgi:hypothetical protein
MITMQFGARYVMGDLTEMQNKLLANAVIKQFVIFAMCFAATRDIITSVILTVAIQAALHWFLNENSTLCLVPAHLRSNKPELQSKLQQQTPPNSIEAAAALAPSPTSIQGRQAAPLHPWSSRPMRANPMSW